MSDQKFMLGHNSRRSPTPLGPLYLNVFIQTGKCTQGFEVAVHDLVALEWWCIPIALGKNGLHNGVNRN
ncbi:MAG: hypothetical protein ACPGYS_02585 [Flavobacteriales bacterium]